LLAPSATHSTSSFVPARTSATNVHEGCSTARDGRDAGVALAVLANQPISARTRGKPLGDHTSGSAPSRRRNCLAYTPRTGAIPMAAFIGYSQSDAELGPEADAARERISSWQDSLPNGRVSTRTNERSVSMASVFFRAFLALSLFTGACAKGTSTAVSPSQSESSLPSTTTGLNVTQLAFTPSSGQALTAEMRWSVDATFTCPVGQVLGVVFERSSDGAVVPFSGAWNCPGVTPATRGFSGIAGSEPTNLIRLAQGGRVRVILALATSIQDWGARNFTLYRQYSAELDVP